MLPEDKKRHDSDGPEETQEDTLREPNTLNDREPNTIDDREPNTEGVFTATERWELPWDKATEEGEDSGPLDG